MRKKILGISIVVISIIIVSSFIFQNSEIQSQKIPNEFEETKVADIVMPTKSSRPGCEETNSCYIPSTMTIKPGNSVIWRNEDVAFHSVTSGRYDDPDGLFDSGHLDPDQSFTFRFENEGDYEYYCTLHPWMKGSIHVSS